MPWVTAWLLLAGYSPARYAAAVYKWIDEHGEVHYGDVMPAQQINKSYSQVGTDGSVISTVAAPKTAEELRIEQEAERRARQREHRDSLLLQTFTSSAEIIVARDNRIAIIDSAIKMAASTIDKLGHQRQALVRQAADHERKGQTIPEPLAGQIESLDRQIDQQRLFTESKQEEKAELQREYAEDIQRFLELTAEAQAAPP